MIAFTLIIVICTLTTVIFAFITVRSSKDTLKKQEELVDWYKNPQIILQKWTSEDEVINKPGYLQILTYSKTNLTELLGINEGDKARKITIWVHNYGRKPFVNAKISIAFEIDNLTLQGSYPFKIYSVTTPIDFLYYNESEDATIHHDQVNFAFMNGTIIDFLPAVDKEANQIIYPPNISLGYIGPGEVIAFNLEIFSIEADHTGNLFLSLHNLEFEDKMNVPLKSVFT